MDISLVFRAGRNTATRGRYCGCNKALSALLRWLRWFTPRRQLVIDTWMDRNSPAWPPVLRTKVGYMYPLQCCVLRVLKLQYPYFSLIQRRINVPGTRLNNHRHRVFLNRTGLIISKHVWYSLIAQNTLRCRKDRSLNKPKPPRR